MGLPVYRIELKDSAMKKLESNIWSDSFVSGTMSMDGRRTPIRIRYRGGHTREYPKKSYEIRTAKATYHFNAEHDDPSLMRNALSFHYFNVLGVPSPSTKHCVLYINGKKEGVYLRIEAVKSAFSAKGGSMHEASSMRSMIMLTLQCRKKMRSRANCCQDTLSLKAAKRKGTASATSSAALTGKKGPS